MPAVKPAKLPDAPSSPNGTPTKPKGPGKTPRNGHAPRRSPNAFVRAWRTVKSIFYASAPNWQVLKSGALLFFGFFCWSSANLLLSYQPGWTGLYVLMAYGFLLTWFGPLTHLVLVPHLIPWLRRRPRGSWLHRIGKHFATGILTLFFAAVLLMGAFPPDVMRVDFRSITTEARTADVNPTLTCTREASNAALIECRLDDAEGVGSIEVTSGRESLVERSDDFTFALSENDLVQVVGRQEFQVVVYTPDGEEARRFTRNAAAIR